MTAGDEQNCCTYCSLPLPRPWWGRGRKSSPSTQPRYCCYGCALAHRASEGTAPSRELRSVLLRLGLAIFLTMNVTVFSMELWTQDVYAAQPDAAPPLAGPLRDVFRYLCLLLSLPVAWLLGKPIAENAWQNLRHGGPLTEMLIVLGVAAAMASSTVAVFRGAGHIYFEVACAVLVMVTIGRLLDANGKVQTTAALDALEKLLPVEVRVVRAGHSCLVAPQDVKVGESVRVLAGERFAFDGHILAGRSAVDEQFLTGESMPIAKGPGDPVYAGAMNLDGSVLHRVDAELRAGALERIANLMRDARQAKGFYQRLADRVTNWFLPAVVVIALAAFSVHAYRSGFDQGVMAGLAVALIACPCALGLASPMAIWAALGRASAAQVLVRSGEVLERLAQVRALAIDKTGTLTSGSPRVADIAVAAGLDQRSVLTLAASVASGSNHPLAKAICQYVQECLPEATPHGSAPQTHTIAGNGLIASQKDGQLIYLGSDRWLRSIGFECDPGIANAIAMALAEGHSVTCIGWEQHIRGVFGFTEHARSDAAQALARCRELGLHVVILTGDNQQRARALGQSLQVDVAAELLPEDKVAAVQGLRLRCGTIAVVGDGINDAPALTAGDVGIAMGCGADISRQAAGICLLTNQLERIPWTIMLARKTVNVVRLNLFWAFFYNSLGIAAACAGWLNPAWAAAAMLISSLLVVSNSLRLRSAVLGNENETVTPTLSPPARAENEQPTTSRHDETMALKGQGQEQLV